MSGVHGLSGDLTNEDVQLALQQASKDASVSLGEGCGSDESHSILVVGAILYSELAQIVQELRRMNDRAEEKS